MSKRSVIQSPVVVAVIWGARAALAQDCLGEPTFYGTTTASTDDAPFTARLCDIDGDGDLDVITANDASDTVSVLLNDGLGSLLELRRWPVGETGTIHEPVDMDCCDFDGDGIMDLVTANHASDGRFHSPWVGRGARCAAIRPGGASFGW